jgi:hypothetical protein
MKKPGFLLIGLVLVFVACKPKISSEVYIEFQNRGSEVSNVAQSVLLENVGRAMNEGGPVYALRFCNLNASSIVDSLNNANQCNIQRISAKNRNPESYLKTKNDNAMWMHFEKGNTHDTLILEGNNLIYYKPIKTAMPACLKCHGTPGSDIDDKTAEQLKKLYPSDLATGYQINDFRGLWKIEFEKE